MATVAVATAPAPVTTETATNGDSNDNNDNNNNAHFSNKSYTPSWEPRIAKKIQSKIEDHTENRPYMIAVVGIPGSGKSVSSFILANLLELSSSTLASSVMVMPHDGYHYPIDYLKAYFTDPDDAIYRRGAPDTFDEDGLLRDLKRIKYNTNDEAIISVPGFDHAKGDPEPDAHIFDRSNHKVVICEGLYLLHWKEVAELFDYRIFLDCDLEASMDRVKIRNLCIPGYTPEEIVIRVDEVDRTNALTVMESKNRASAIVRSANDRSRDDDNDTITVITAASAISALETITHTTTADALLDPKIEFTSLSVEHDWMLEINTHPNAAIEIDANESIGSDIYDPLLDDSDPPPEPVSSFVGTWEPGMAKELIQALEVHEAKHKELGTTCRVPFMVSIVGGPGTGKSISALLMANELEKHGINVMVMPHDGYHYPLEYLKTFPNADDLVYRRGAPETFDASILHRDLQRIKGCTILQDKTNNNNSDQGNHEPETVIKLPAFDHGKGDPEPDTHIFDRNIHQVVLCEGLYLLHDEDGWEPIAHLFDKSIYMETDIDDSMERVKIRNQCIPGYTPEEIAVRVEKVDRVNALTVQRSQKRADVIVNAIRGKQIIKNN